VLRWMLKRTREPVNGCMGSGKRSPRSATTPRALTWSSSSPSTRSTTMSVFQPSRSASLRRDARRLSRARSIACRGSGRDCQARRQSNGAPYGLHHQIVCLRLPRAGAEQHHHSQRKQRSHAEEQDRCGNPHWRIYRALVESAVQQPALSNQRGLRVVTTYGNGVACEPVPPAASIGALPFVGITSFWPTLIWSVRRLLAVRRVLADTP